MASNDQSERRKVSELKHQLSEERQAAKKTIGKLQRELQRRKGDASPSSPEVQQSLMKELDRERTMRLDAERRLGDMQVESDSGRARLKALQDEFRKMNEVVANVLQYKTKIDQLKQESASMKTTYENNLQKYCNHLSTLERDNVMLMNQVKKMEAQLHGKGDERDKSKLLLERLKMVEAENSALVLENEQQRQQYEKCLDEIANQVVQALLAQKTLREECLKLQSRVKDLELQNKHLNILFHQRVRFTSDSVLQVQHTHVCHSSAASGTTGAVSMPHGEMTVHFLDNAESLQSMCSEIMIDDSPGKPQLSSPPPWLKEKLAVSPGRTREVSASSSSSSSTTSPSVSDMKEQIIQMKIETEFPATNTSPKVKHISISERRTRSLERGMSSLMSHVRKAEHGAVRGRRGSETQDRSHASRPRLKQSASVDAIGQMESAESFNPWQLGNGVANTPHAVDLNTTWNGTDSALLPHTDPNHSSFEAFNKDFAKLLSKHSVEDNITSTPQTPRNVDIKKKDKSKLSSPPRTNPPNSQSSRRIPQHTSKNYANVTPALRNPFAETSPTPKSPSHASSQYYYYDYSDEDSDSRPVSRDFSTASTMSLNELLDSSMEGEVAIDDDFFSDWSSVRLSPQKRLDNLSGQAISNKALEASNKAGHSTSSSSSRSTSSSPDASGIPLLQGSFYEKGDHSKYGPPFSRSGFADTKGVNPSAQKGVVEKATVRNLVPLKSRSQQTKSKIALTSATSPPVRPNATVVSAEVHADVTGHCQHSSSPSPNLSQKSQDLGYASKGSLSQSSPSPSPSMPHRPAPPWLHNSGVSLADMRTSPHMIASPDSPSSSSSTSSSTRLVRPGQLGVSKSSTQRGVSAPHATGHSDSKSSPEVVGGRGGPGSRSLTVERRSERAPQLPTSENSKKSLPLSKGSGDTQSKSASKIPPPIAKKPSKAAKGDSGQTEDQESASEFPGPGNTDVIVGYLLQSHLPQVPLSTNALDDVVRLSLKDTGDFKSRTRSDSIGTSLPPKCHSSDSSCENLSTERSVGKDDGYSTMSSDIHPEILDKFGDSLCRKLSETDSEPPFSESLLGTLRDAKTQSPVTPRGVNDDSVLEGSVFCTPEADVSLSSVVSTSSGDLSGTYASAASVATAGNVDCENATLTKSPVPSADDSCEQMPCAGLSKGRCRSASVSSSASSEQGKSAQPSRLPWMSRRHSDDFSLQQTRGGSLPSPRSSTSSLDCSRPRSPSKRSSFPGSAIPVPCTSPRSPKAKAPSSTSKATTTKAVPDSPNRLPKGYFCGSTTVKSSPRDPTKPPTGRALQSKGRKEASKTAVLSSMQKGTQKKLWGRRQKADSCESHTAQDRGKNSNSLNVEKESLQSDQINEFLSSTETASHNTPAFGTSNPKTSCQNSEGPKSSLNAPLRSMIIMNNEAFRQFSSDSDISGDESCVSKVTVNCGAKLVEQSKNVDASESELRLNTSGEYQSLETSSSHAAPSQTRELSPSFPVNEQGTNSFYPEPRFVGNDLPLPHQQTLCDPHTFASGSLKTSSPFSSCHDLAQEGQDSFRLRRCRSEQNLCLGRQVSPGSQQTWIHSQGSNPHTLRATSSLEEIRSPLSSRPSVDDWWHNAHRSANVSPAFKHFLITANEEDSHTAPCFLPMFRPHITHHGYPGYSRSLRLNLSDVTELDEETSVGSLVDLTGDESPRLSVEEQKQFKSQFYSLCKVDSHRSLLSAGSRDRQSFTSLTELLSNKSFDTLGSGAENEAEVGEQRKQSSGEDEKDEAALREFDEISKQIASLSQTVDALNLSLCSLNSGEHESSAVGGTDPVPYLVVQNATKSGSTDEYHWLDDEFFVASFNGKTSVLPGNENFVEASSQRDSPGDVKFRHSGVSPAMGENSPLCSPDFGSHKRDTWPLADTEGLRHGERSSFIFRPDGQNWSLSKTVSPEKHVSAPVLDGQQDPQLRRWIDGRQDGEKEEAIGGANCGEHMKPNDLDLFAASSEESDDSLASDIGLDHMICQRLFGRKGHAGPSMGQVWLPGGTHLHSHNLMMSLVQRSAAAQLLVSQRLDTSSLGAEQEVGTTWDSAMGCGSIMKSPTGSSRTEPKQKSCPVGRVSPGNAEQGEDGPTSSNSLRTHMPKQEDSSLYVQGQNSCKSLDRETADRTTAMVCHDSLPTSTEGVQEDFAAQRSRIPSMGCGRQRAGNKSKQNFDLTSYSDFVKELKTSGAKLSGSTVPPRRPIVTNGSLRFHKANKLPVRPTSLPCKTDKRFLQFPQRDSNPYENTLDPQGPSSEATLTKPLTSSQPNCVLPTVHVITNPPHRPHSASVAGTNFPVSPGREGSPAMSPPPLPPRQPLITHTQDGRPQVMIRPHNVRSPTGDSRGETVRPQSFNQYLIDKSKAELSSSVTPDGEVDFERIRHCSDSGPPANSESQVFQVQGDLQSRNQKKSVEKSKVERPLSWIPRRKRLSKRDRSKRLREGERSLKDTSGKRGSRGTRLWCDLDLSDDGNSASDSSREADCSS
ncbi:uncharacterized protein LOC101859276 [Aplysia californica]|uniref:Uncharacterized protein LOC101859276 n=1 Tax=Aplysia californica TaxID=6500 RepID=A0ABM0K5V3_APLCA|nr:uncharacterized protein LOC101859276 [Aplysia californica]